MSIQETHEWAKEKMKRWEGLTKEASSIASRPQERVLTPDALDFENASFRGDVCNIHGDLVFHFFPTPNDRFNLVETLGTERTWVFPPTFADFLGDAFIEVFKRPERLFWDYVPELQSWVVRCSGYGDNPLVIELVERMLVALKKKNNEDG